MRVHAACRLARVVCATALLVAAASVAAAETFRNIQLVESVGSPNGLEFIVAGVDGSVAVALQRRAGGTTAPGGDVSVYDFTRPMSQARRGTFVAGRVGGVSPIDPADIAVELPYASIVGGYQLVIVPNQANYWVVLMDLQNLDSPQKLSETDVNSDWGIVAKTAIEGDRVCVTRLTGVPMLLEIPFSDPVAEAVELPAGKANEAGFDGNRLVVSGPFVQLLDLSAGAAASVLEGLAAPPRLSTYSGPVLVMGDTIFQTFGNHLSLIDASNPSSPVERGRLTVPSSILGVTRMTDDLIVVSSWLSLQVVDVSDISLPRVVGEWLDPADWLIRRGVVALPDGEMFVFSRHNIHHLRFANSESGDSTLQRDQDAEENPDGTTSGESEKGGS